MEGRLQISHSTLAQYCEVPHGDMAEWLGMKLEERTLVLERLDAVREILLSGKPNRACAQIAKRKRFEGCRGWSQPTLYRLYSHFVKSGGDWHVLKREYKGPSGGLPEEFVAYFRERLLSSARKTPCRAARRELVHAFRRGDSIPGYGTKYEWAKREGRAIPGITGSDRELPDGWSLRTLQRIKPKSKYILDGARQGVFAAHSSEPAMLLRDKSKLRFMEWVAFDDVRLDKRCLISEPGFKRQIGYPLAVFALDVGTGIDVAHCVKPRLKREEDGTKFGIASEEVKILILNMIETYGLPPYPVNFLIENAAATLSDADELALKQTFGDRIRIHRCGTMRDAFLSNGFYEGGGKPWFKSWIEVFFRPFQEHLAFTDGATGNRYDNTPAQLAKAEQYVRNLLKKCGERDDIVDRLKLPLPRYEEVLDDIERILRVMRNRTDHNLQGFELVTEWRKDKSDTIHKAAELAGYSDVEIASFEIWDRIESPAERAVRLASGTKWWRPDPAYFCHLYALKHVLKFKISNGGITFEAKSLKRHKAEKIMENLVFAAPPHDVIEKYTGVEVLCYFSDDLSCAHLTKDGRHICSLNRVRRIDVRDEKALKKAAGEVHQRRLSDRNVLDELMPQRNAKLAEMREENIGLLKDAGLLGAEMKKAERRKEKAAGRALRDFSDSSQLVGTAALQDGGEGGLEDFSDPSELI